MLSRQGRRDTGVVDQPTVPSDARYDRLRAAYLAALRRSSIPLVPLPIRRRSPDLRGRLRAVLADLREVRELRGGRADAE